MKRLIPAVALVLVSTAGQATTFTVQHDTLWVEGAPEPCNFVQAAFTGAVTSIDAIGVCATWSIEENPSGPYSTWLWQAIDMSQGGDWGAGFTGKQAVAVAHGGCRTLSYRFPANGLSSQWACNATRCDAAEEITNLGGCTSDVLETQEWRAWSGVKALYR